MRTVRSRRVPARAVCLLAPALVGLVLATPAVPAALPARYYLALGDSVAWGYGAGTERAIATGTLPSGYVGRFAAALRAHGHPVRVVNLGCPGETTRSFVSGPCGWAAGGNPMHRAYDGSQLNAATAFLRAHPGAVGPITLTLWANDDNDLARACSGDLDCLRERPRRRSPGWPRASGRSSGGSGTPPPGRSSS